MHLYTLTPGFMPKDIINEFISAIWTERYSEAGDVQLVTPASSEMIKKLAHGTFLGLKGTKEVMILDTQSIEDGLLTVKGQSLLKFLDERAAWFENPDPLADEAIMALTDDTTAGELISSAVSQMVIDPPGFDDGPAMYRNLNWLEEIIPGLELGRVDSTGAIKRLTIDLGTLYNSIQSLAQEEGIGLKLYLESATTSSGPVFKFATYRGKNRTSDQSTHAIVRLTPKMDSLSEVKEVSSNSQYKNVVYVVYKGMTVHYAEPTLPIPEGFDRRVLVVQADDIFLEETRYEAYREQVARDTFANNNYVHAVDGQASPQGIYQYTVDYDLGDIIELEGLTGTLSKARITEYIRSQDKTGDREYPTLSVVDHLSTGTIPDTEPEPIEPPGDGDPDFDDDVSDPEPDPVPDPDPEPDPNPDPEPDFDHPDTDPDTDPDSPPDLGDPDPDTPVVIDDWQPTDDEDVAEVSISDRVPASTYSGYYTAHLHAETVIQYTPPPGWGEQLEGYPLSYGEENDSFGLYGLLVELSIGHDTIYPYLTQGQVDRWVMPLGPEGDDPGGYVVKWDDADGTPTLPAISIDFTYTAAPFADLWFRIPPPQNMGPVSLRLVKTGRIHWYKAARYQFGFKLADEQDINETWSVPWVHGNFTLTWEYHPY